jgi:signal transduction histidine kinase
MMDEISTAYERRLQYVEEIIHDIVTPVQILEGYRQLIERHGRTESLVDEFLEAARIELKRLRDMALILKETQREEKQKSLEWIDASEITKRIVQTYKEIHPEIFFQWEIAPKVLLQIDPLDLERIEHILLDNAVKYGGMEVWIRLTSEEFWVEDRGPGIATEDQERVFERNYRCQASVNGKSGAGLGLFILKKFAEEYRFYIRVENGYPSGCIIRLVFS